MTFKGSGVLCYAVLRRVASCCVVSEWMAGISVLLTSGGIQNMWNKRSALLCCTVLCCVVFVLNLAIGVSVLSSP